MTTKKYSKESKLDAVSLVSVGFYRKVGGLSEPFYTCTWEVARFAGSALRRWRINDGLLQPRRVSIGANFRWTRTPLPEEGK
jgi:hypothetical protein